MNESSRVALHGAAGLPLVAGLIAWGLLPSTPWWLQLALTLAALGVLGYLVQTSSAWLFGPVLRYEIVRQTRSARIPALRVGYAALLLLALFLVYVEYSPGYGSERWVAAFSEGAEVEPNQYARFSAHFFYTFVGVQFAVILVFTPALFVGTIVGDKHGGTLDVLLTTHLTNREIVLGVLAARLGSLFLLLLTGLPVLCLVQLFGGVEPKLVAACFLGSLLTLFTLGAVCLASSLYTSKMHYALAISYGFAAFHCLQSFNAWTAFSLHLGNGQLKRGYILLAVYGAYAVGSGCAAVVGSILRLRPVVEKEPKAPIWPLERGRLRETRPAPPETTAADSPPALGDGNPLIWKEIYRPRGFFGFKPPVLKQLLVLTLAVLFVPLPCLPLYVHTILDPQGDHRVQVLWNEAICTYGVAGFQVLLIVAALRAAACFSRERERKTLDGLLCSSLSDGEIVYAKWLACLWSVRLWIIPFVAVGYFGIAVGGLSWQSALLALGACVVHLVFAVNLGLYCSAANATTWSASVATVLSLLALAAGHWLIAPFSQALAHALSGWQLTRFVYDVHRFGLTLPGNLAAFCFTAEDAEQPYFWHLRLQPALVGLLYYAGLALLFHQLLYRRLRSYRRA